MKKYYLLVFLSVLTVIATCCLITGCGKTTTGQTKKEYVVSFYVDDVCVKTVKSGGNEEIEFPENPSKDGYTFVGWACTFSNGYTETHFTSGYYRTIPMTEDVKAIAQWKKKITIHFEMNGGFRLNSNEPLSDEIISEGQKSDRINTVIEKENAVFVGWYDNPELEGDRITDPYYPTENVTLYAAWVDEASATTDDGWYLDYDANMGGYSAWMYDGENTELVIPSSYKGVPVVKINGTFYFKNYQTINNKITSIVTSKNLKVIGDGAFSGCNFLTSVTIGDAVEEVGNNAFNGRVLENLVVGKNLKYLGSNAFGDVYSSPWAKTLPEGAIYFGNVLYRYKGTASGAFSVKSGTTAIAENAFSGQNELTSVTFPKGVEIIGRQAFYGCTQLKTIDMPDTLTDIYAYAFYNCTALETFVMPNSVTALGDGTFSGCTSLRSVTLSENLTRLEYCMFENCPITELSVPEKVKFLGNAFLGNTTLQKITIKNANIDFGELALAYIPESVTVIYVHEDSVGAFKTEFPEYADKFFAMT